MGDAAGFDCGAARELEGALNNKHDTFLGAQGQNTIKAVVVPQDGSSYGLSCASSSLGANPDPNLGQAHLQVGGTGGSVDGVEVLSATVGVTIVPQLVGGRLGAWSNPDGGHSVQAGFGDVAPEPVQTDRLDG